MWFYICLGALFFMKTLRFETTEPGTLQRDKEHRVSAIFAVDTHKHLSVPSTAEANVSDVTSCSWLCLKNFKCLTFNFAVKKIQNLFKCELLSTDKYNSSGHFKDSIEYNHHRIESPCDYAPCMNGATCQHDYRTSNYICHCAAGCNGKKCEWKKVNTNPVCFSAKGNQYGAFITPDAGQIKGFKLVHLSGRVAAYGSGTNWGTSSTRFDTIITDALNQITSPPRNMLHSTWYKYTLPGVSASDPELILPELNPPLAVTAGQKFRVWFGEDLINASEFDNSGTTCANVFVNYKQ